MSERSPVHIPFLFEQHRSVLLCLLFDAFEYAACTRATSRIGRHLGQTLGVDLVVVMSRHLFHQQVDFVGPRRRTNQIVEVQWIPTDLNGNVKDESTSDASPTTT